MGYSLAISRQYPCQAYGWIYGRGQRDDTKARLVDLYLALELRPPMAKPLQRTPV